MSFQNILVCFHGDSQSGKSKLMMECEEHFCHHIRIIRSTTTRDRRLNETEEIYRKFYRHASVDFFKESINLERFIEWDEYAGNFYGTTHEALDHVLSQSHGMLAVTEKTIPHLQSLGLHILSIQIIGLNTPESNDPLRQRADEQRRGTVTPDYTISNDFAPGGLEKACTELVRILFPYITEI